MTTKKAKKKKKTTAMNTNTQVLLPPPVLTAPFSWRDPDYQPFLERLQGNILKGHGRHHTQNIFFTIADGLADEARRVLKVLATQYVTSALKQLRETDDFKEARALGEVFNSDPFVSILLTKLGYDALGITGAAVPGDSKFQAGMQSRTLDLNDPAPAEWDPGFLTPPHGLIMVAGETPEEVDVITAVLLGIVDGVLLPTQLQRGKAIFNSNGEGLEHFGYVDGRSQPLFLLEDLDTERAHAGMMMWDPAFSPDRVVVHDPGASGDAHAFGSYFIFRKLEEHVRAFKTREQELADELGLTGGKRERAGALCIGRFEDGTPVTLSPEALAPAHGHVPNDFNYDQDVQAGKCPFHGHIRKVNPRGSALGSTTERLTIMARRGITYEDVPRVVHPDDLPEAEDLAEFLETVAPLLPEDKLGLLFMAYNVDITQQFEVTQRFWANNPTFPPPNPSAPPPVPPFGEIGIDPVIGQTQAANPTQQWPDEYVSGRPAVKPFSFHGHVTLRGGDYFFAPSLTFLRSL